MLLSLAYLLCHAKWFSSEFNYSYKRIYKTNKHWSCNLKVPKNIYFCRNQNASRAQFRGENGDFSSSNFSSSTRSAPSENEHRCQTYADDATFRLRTYGRHGDTANHCMVTLSFTAVIAHEERVWRSWFSDKIKHNKYRKWIPRPSQNMSKRFSDVTKGRNVTSVEAMVITMLPPLEHW